MEELQTVAVQHDVKPDQSAQPAAIPAPLPSAFQSRIDAVFGTLGGGASEGGWSLNTSLVFKPGKDIPALEADDVDEDEGMEVARSRSNPLMSGDVWAADDEGDEDGGDAACDPGVSLQFRQAFEDEEEADEYDEVAATSYTSEDTGRDTRRMRHMEVADDNIFERLCANARQLHGISVGHVTPMDVEDPGPESASIKTTERKKSKDKRRVRFKLDSGNDDDADNQQPSGGSPRKKSTEIDKAQNSNQNTTENGRGDEANGAANDRAVSHRSAGPRPESEDASGRRPIQWNRNLQPQRGAQRNPGRGRQRGRRIPDHVANPHKWTCYTLDEPIYVGQGAPRESEREQQLAVASSDMATSYIKDKAEDLEPRFDPNQQSQIVFKRKEASSSKQEASHAEGEGKKASKPDHSRLLASLHAADEEGGDDTVMHTADAPQQAPANAVAFHRPSVTGRKRSLRSRSTSEDDHMDDASG